jgi:hypothetical protein
LGIDFGEVDDLGLECCYGLETRLIWANWLFNTITLLLFNIFNG